MKIYIASDHAGVDLKKHLQTISDYEWVDLGPNSNESVDYPDYADQVCKALLNDPTAKGLLVCGSGQGMAMRANKYTHIRAALCWNAEVSKLSREHNNANVLCMGARFVSESLAIEMTKAFFSTIFAGGRHEQRVNKVSRPV